MRQRPRWAYLLNIEIFYFLETCIFKDSISYNMAKRTRSGDIIRHLKRPIEDSNDSKQKRIKLYEYWQHQKLSRREKALRMAARYTRLLHLK